MNRTIIQIEEERKTVHGQELNMIRTTYSDGQVLFDAVINGDYNKGLIDVESYGLCLLKATAFCGFESKHGRNV